MIERAVVLQIDEELGGCAVDVIGARHGQGTALVLDAIVGLVLDRRVSTLLRHVFGETAALDDEAGNDPVKDRVVEESVVDVLQKIGDG